MRQKFRARPGAQFPKEKAEIYGREIQRIARNNSGSLTPHDLVKAAEDPVSPLREAFNWDDASAAHSWRVQQARALTNSIEVAVRTPSGSEVWVDVLYSIKVKVRPVKGEPVVPAKKYVLARVVQKSADARAQVSEAAFVRLDANIAEIVKMAELADQPEKAQRLNELATVMLNAADEMKTIAFPQQKAS